MLHIFVHKERQDFLYVQRYGLRLYIAWRRIYLYTYANYSQVIAEDFHLFGATASDV
jgi:hypothetical protein